MPAITAALKSFSDFIVAYRQHLIVFIFLGILLLITYWATEKGKRKMYRFMINMPIVWNMTKSYYLIKWARYMKLMISSGMDYVDTFRLLRDVLKIPLYQSMIEHVLADISLWKSLYEPISEHTDIIPSNVSVLIKVWEETANLENAMQNVIDIYQEELDNSIKNFSKAIEPFILIFVWWIVLMIALGVFSLIFAVMDSAGIW
jgi:type II secretory pathway component PulF